MFKTWFSNSHHSTNGPNNKLTKDTHDSTNARAWYFTAPNPNNGQKYTTTGVPSAHKGSQQQISIVVNRKGNVPVEVMAHGRSQGQGHGTSTAAKHHITNAGSHPSHPHSNPHSSQPNTILVSPADPSSHTRRHEKHTSAPVVSNDDRLKGVNKRHSIIGYAPRSDVATTGGSIAPRTISSDKHRSQPQSQSHAHRASDDRRDVKKYPKSPHPTKPALPTSSSRHNPSPENRHPHLERHVDGHSHSHQSSKHHTFPHQPQSQSHRHSSYELHSSGNVPLRTSHGVKPVNLESAFNTHSQAFLQAPSHSQHLPQANHVDTHARSHSHSRSRSHSRSPSRSRPHSAEKHVRYLNPTHPDIIPDQQHLRPSTAQPYATSAPAATAPISFVRSRRNSMPGHEHIAGTFFGDPHSDSRNFRGSHSYQGGHDIHTYRFPRPRGWFNRRGDQYIAKGMIRKQPTEMQWHPMFASYPEVGRGWMDEEGQFMPASGGILKA